MSGRRPTNEPPGHAAKRLLALRSRHLPRDNLPVPFLVDPDHRSAKVDRAKLFAAKQPFEGDQQVNDRRIAVHMYRFFPDVNRLVFQRAGLEIRDLLILGEQFAVAVNDGGVLSVILLIEAGIVL